MHLDAERDSPASHFRRLIARLIDTGVLAATAALVFGAGLLLWNIVAAIEDKPRGSESWGAAVALGFFLLYVFVPSLPAAVYVCEVILPRKTGQTLGKRLVGLRVLRRCDDATASLLTGGRMVARTAVMYVPPAAALVVSLFGTANQHWYRSTILLAIPAYALVLTVPVLLTKQRRGVHDWAAGTVVVRAPHGSERPQRRGSGGEGFDRWQGSTRGNEPASGPGL